MAQHQGRGMTTAKPLDSCGKLSGPCPRASLGKCVTDTGWAGVALVCPCALQAGVSSGERLGGQTQAHRV